VHTAGLRTIRCRSFVRKYIFLDVTSGIVDVVLYGTVDYSCMLFVLAMLFIRFGFVSVSSFM